MSHSSGIVGSFCLGAMCALALGCTFSPNDGTEASAAEAAREGTGSRTSTASGGPGRRIFEGCVPAEAVHRYDDLVGERVQIAWSWNDPSAASARLRAPAVVLRIDADSVAVDFDRRMPNRALYVSAWTYSGHISANADGSFAVDPCSATIEPGGW